MDLIYPKPLIDHEIKLTLEADGERFGDFITKEELDKLINYGKTTLE